MKQIPLTRGLFALVDDHDFEWLSQWKWRAMKGRHTYYAIRQVWVPEKENYDTVLMHRQIVNEHCDTVDHRNGNGLDNQRYNLRAATYSQNQYNRKTNKNNSSGFPGIRWEPNRNRWRARLTINGVERHIGRFKSLEEAIKARNELAISVHPEFAIQSTINQ